MTSLQGSAVKSAEKISCSLGLGGDEEFQNSHRAVRIILNHPLASSSRVRQPELNQLSRADMLTETVAAGTGPAQVSTKSSA